VSVAVGVEEGRIVGVVEDDGRGFDPGTTDGGSGGLAHMAQRASSLRGSCSVRSAPGGELPPERSRASRALTSENPLRAKVRECSLATVR